VRIETKYSYEKLWQLTQEEDLLKIITQEIGDADPKGTLIYIKESLKKGKEIGIGSCKFRKKS
jgi:hypothetical protein